MIDPLATVNSWPFAYASGKRIVDVKMVVIDPTVDILAFANVDAGIARSTRIGEGCRIDHYAHVGHDSILARDVTVCAGAIICGFVEIEENAYLGAGCRIRQRLRIGKNALIGMGAIVVKDVPPNCVVVGSPARFLRYRFPNEPETRDMKWNGAAWV